MPQFLLLFFFPSKFWSVQQHACPSGTARPWSQHSFQGSWVWVFWEACWWIRSRRGTGLAEQTNSRSSLHNGQLCVCPRVCMHMCNPFLPSSANLPRGRLLWGHTISLLCRCTSYQHIWQDGTFKLKFSLFCSTIKLGMRSWRDVPGYIWSAHPNTSWSIMRRHLVEFTFVYNAMHSRQLPCQALTSISWLCE